MTFVPHLLPIRRGILVDDVRPARGPASTRRHSPMRSARATPTERFIVLTGSRPPEIRDVVGTNDCAIGWTLDATQRHGRRSSRSIDNLGKGAAGQAIQNFNVMMGLPETDGPRPSRRVVP